MLLEDVLPLSRLLRAGAWQHADLGQQVLEIRLVFELLDHDPKASTSILELDSAVSSGDHVNRRIEGASDQRSHRGKAQGRSQVLPARDVELGDTTLRVLVAAKDGDFGRIRRRFGLLTDTHRHQVMLTTAILLES
jgi:hypothetical protein